VKNQIFNQYFKFFEFKLRKMDSTDAPQILEH
jgi:hypothetical protein